MNVQWKDKISVNSSTLSASHYNETLKNWPITSCYPQHYIYTTYLFLTCVPSLVLVVSAVYRLVIFLGHFECQAITQPKN